MATQRVRVHVRLKNGVLDPQGVTIAGALRGLGFSGVEDVRFSRLIDLDLAGDLSDDGALAQARDMAERLLANTVIESYTVELLSK